MVLCAYTVLFQLQ